MRQLGRPGSLLALLIGPLSLKYKKSFHQWLGHQGRCVSRVPVVADVAVRAVFSCGMHRHRLSPNFVGTQSR